MRANYKKLYEETLFDLRSIRVKIGKKTNSSGMTKFPVESLQVIDTLKSDLNSLREQANDWYAKWQLAERNLEDLKTQNNKLDAANSHLIAALHNIDYSRNI